MEQKRWVWGTAIAIVMFALIVGWFAYGMITHTDQNGRTPKDAVIVYEKALSEKDGMTLKQVATDDQAQRTSTQFGFSLVSHKQQGIADPGYLMKEYKLDQNEYWYEVKWFYNAGNTWSKMYRVMYTDDKAWRVEIVDDKEEWKQFTDGMQAKVIRENPHD